MTTAYRISSTAQQIDNRGTHLEIEPIHDVNCPRASFCVSDGDPEAISPLVVELDLEEIGELRQVLGKLEGDLRKNPTDG